MKILTPTAAAKQVTVDVFVRQFLNGDDFRLFMRRPVRAISKRLTDKQAGGIGRMAHVHFQQSQSTSGKRLSRVSISRSHFSSTFVSVSCSWQRDEAQQMVFHAAARIVGTRARAQNKRPVARLREQQFARGLLERARFSARWRREIFSRGRSSAPARSAGADKSIHSIR